MANYFVISTDAMTSQAERAFADFIKSKAAWWHWLPNFWLVKDGKEQLTATIIRDKLSEIDSTRRCMVLQVEPITWSAMTRKDKGGREMGEWVRNNWKK